MQPLPEVWRLNLARVGRADRADQIGEDDTPLEEVQPVVELQLQVVEQLPIQASQRHVAGKEPSLVENVVDGEKCVNVPVLLTQAGVGVAAVDFFEVDGDQASLPVVGVDNGGPEGEQAPGFEDGTTKKDKKSPVIGGGRFVA